MSVDNNDPNVDRETKKNPVRNVAVVGLINENNEILIVRTKRFPDHWQPIGGGVKDRDQSPAHTLQRELEEETNIHLEIEQFRRVIITDYDFGEGKVYFYTAKITNDVSPIFDTTELVEWKWCKPSSALSLSMFPATRKFLEKLNHD